MDYEVGLVVRSQSSLFGGESSYILVAMRKSSKSNMRVAGLILGLATLLTPVFAQNQVIRPGDILVVRFVWADAQLPFEDRAVITTTTDGKITGLVIDGTELPDLVVQGSSFETASKTLLAAYEYSAKLAYKRTLRTGKPTLQNERFKPRFGAQVVIERQTPNQPLR